MAGITVDDLALDAEPFEVGELPHRRAGRRAGLGRRRRWRGRSGARRRPRPRRRDAAPRPRPRRRRRRRRAGTSRPVVTVPVLSSTIVSTRRVDSSTSGPLIRMPSWAPRPVPTIRAVGVASPRAHGQAMIRTATAAVNAAVSPASAPIQNPRVATDSAITIGTKIPETRSARRWTCALPFCASSTSRAIWASWVSAPTRVARTTSRPPALTVAPTTGSPTPTSTGTDSPVSIEASTAESPSSTTPSVATFSPGRTTNRIPTASWSVGIRISTPWAVAEDGDVLGAELEQRPQRGAGAPLGAGLEVAAGEDERRHAGGGLEVDVAGAVGALDGELERVGHARGAGGTPEQRVERPAEGGQDAHRDQGVHGRGAVPQVDPGGPVEGPGAPHHDRRGEREREPLPVGELQRRDHRHRDHRHGQHRGDDQALAQRTGRGRRRPRLTPPRPTRQRGVVPGLPHGVDQVVGRQRLGIGDLRLLRGVVDRGDDAVELVELALDPVRAGGAGHPGDLELDVGGEVSARGHGTLPPSRADLRATSRA